MEAGPHADELPGALSARPARSATPSAACSSPPWTPAVPYHHGPTWTLVHAGLSRPSGL